VQDFVNIQIGDIIKIDKKVNEELEVYVGDIKKFEALPGYSNDKYAVRITEVIREESE
jgi:flagellar motor switch protein FliM